MLRVERINPMNTIRAILTRRSIRRFRPEPVPRQLIDELLKAAMHAPSAGNQQPWHFVVVDERGLLDRVPGFHPHASMCREAPLGILVCGDLQLETHEGMWMQDCAAAAQNLMLAAHDKGLGSVWVSSYPRPDRMEGFRALVHLPEQVLPLAFVVIGYPDEAPRAGLRFREERIHRNRW